MNEERKQEIMKTAREILQQLEGMNEDEVTYTLGIAGRTAFKLLQVNPNGAHVQELMDDMYKKVDQTSRHPQFDYARWSEKHGTLDWNPILNPSVICKN